MADSGKGILLTGCLERLALLIDCQSDALGRAAAKRDYTATLEDARITKELVNSFAVLAKLSDLPIHSGGHAGSPAPQDRAWLQDRLRQRVASRAAAIEKQDGETQGGEIHDSETRNNEP